MSDLRSLIMGKGSEAALGVDQAKAAVEEAKLNLEAAKNHLSDANAIFDAVLLEMEASGLSKSKAKKAIEEINQTLVSIGILTENTPVVSDATVEKPVRRKRKGKNEDDVQTEDNNVNTTVEVTEITNEVGDDVTDVVVQRGDADEIVELIDASVTNLNLEDQTEIKRLLNDSLELAIVNANEQDMYLDLDFFSQFLNGGVLSNVDLGTFGQDAATNVFAAFVNVIEAVETQRGSVHLILNVEPDVVTEVEDNTIEDEISVAVDDTVVQDVVTSEIDIVVSNDDESVVEDNAHEDDHYAHEEEIEEDHYLNHYEEPEEETISDDESFPVSGSDVPSEVAVVGNVADMNFFEAEAPVESEQKVEAPKPNKLAPPSFLKKPSA